MTTIEWLTLSMVIVSSTLVLITGVYAYHTYRMASIMKETFMLERRPYITLEEIKVSDVQIYDSNEAGVQVFMTIRNVGKTLANYSMKDMSVMIDNKTETAQNPHFHNFEASIFPGTSRTIICPIIKDVDPSEKTLKGVIDYTLEYHGVKKAEVFTSHKIIDILIDRSKMQWLITEEHET
jgi:archaellum component FlaF (FlaF/FlaG flagellin family)